MRRAHSLTELMMALVIGALAVSAVYMARFSGEMGGSQNVDPGAMADLQWRLRQLVVEIQDATRVFYPLPGEGVRDGLGITTSKSETVIYHVEPVSGQSQPRLMRVNLSELRRGGKDQDGAFVDRLHHMRFEVAPAEPGKMASLVRIDLAVEMPGRTPDQTVRVSYLSAAFPRNLERPVPEDVLLPGSPLVRNW